MRPTSCPARMPVSSLPAPCVRRSQPRHEARSRTSAAAPSPLTPLLLAVPLRLLDLLKSAAAVPRVHVEGAVGVAALGAAPLPPPTVRLLRRPERRGAAEQGLALQH